MSFEIAVISLNNMLFISQGCIMMFLLAGGIYFITQRGMRLKHLLGCILLFWFGLHLKDLLWLDPNAANYDRLQLLFMSIDMLAVPTCTFLMLELTRPGWFTWRRVLLHETPFLLLTLLCSHWQSEIVFTLNIILALAYSLCIVFRLFRTIPEYNRIVSDNYSFTEDIDLVWLWKMLIFFIFFIAIWAYSCIRLSAGADILYNLTSCCLWGVICYHINTQKILTAADLQPTGLSPSAPAGNTCRMDFAEPLETLFSERRLHLNPHLTINDVAQALGTNRTYLSEYLNHSLNTTFYEYVNTHRVRAVAEQLASASCPLTIEAVAESCGFNSTSTFRRVFLRHYGCTPCQYKTRHGA